MADFPDLNNDGKVTRADVLKGRGVFKKGGKVKKYNKGGMELYNEALQAGGRSGIAAAKESTLGKPSTPEKKEMIKKESTKLGTLDFPYSKKTSREFSEMKKGGKVSSASKRADGIAQRGKTRA